MRASYFSEIAIFFLLIAFQVILLQHITLFGVATPIVYSYLLIKLPLNRNPFFVIIASFLLGFTIDIFLNTPGMNAAATTIMALIRPLLLNVFYAKEEFEAYIPNIHSNRNVFIRFSAIMVLLHQTMLFFIESFTFFNFHLTIIRILASSALTLVLILALDKLTNKKPAFE